MKRFAVVAPLVLWSGLAFAPSEVAAQPAAALVAAAELGTAIDAVVSRGGRPDLAGPALPRVTSPTLLIVGGHDDVVLQLNEEAFGQLACEKELAVVPRATHLFEEPGALENVARLAWSSDLRQITPSYEGAHFDLAGGHVWSKSFGDPTYQMDREADRLRRGRAHG